MIKMNNVIKVMYWVNNGYRRYTRAYIIATDIVKETDRYIRIQIDDNVFMNIKRNDIVSIEEVVIM